MTHFPAGNNNWLTVGLVKRAHFPVEYHALIDSEVVHGD